MAAVAAASVGLSAEMAERAYQALAWLGILVEKDGERTLAADLGPFLTGLGFHFHEVALLERDERFNTNCALDFFIMTHRPTRQHSLQQLAGGKVPELAGEGMSPAMVEALRHLSSANVDSVFGRNFYEGEPAVLNDACGWSDTWIRVVMDHGKLVEVTPESAWYLRGGG